MELSTPDDAVTAQALFPQDGRLFLRLCSMWERPVSVRFDRPVKSVNLALKRRKAEGSSVLLNPWRAQTYQIGRID